MLGVLFAAIGGFMAIAIWDTEHQRRTLPQITALVLIALGVALFVAGLSPRLLAKRTAIKGNNG